MAQSFCGVHKKDKNLICEAEDPDAILYMFCQREYTVNLCWILSTNRISEIKWLPLWKSSMSKSHRCPNETDHYVPKPSSTKLAILCQPSSPWQKKRWLCDRSYWTFSIHTSWKCNQNPNEYPVKMKFCSKAESHRFDIDLQRKLAIPCCANNMFLNKSFHERMVTLKSWNLIGRPLGRSHTYSHPL